MGYTLLYLLYFTTEDMCKDLLVRPTLQISLDLCIPEKELAKTRSQISFIYFQSVEPGILL
jgi:hypothetical protein